ncbi:MAG TPA: DUF2059 domain-containing protein [Candidatus Acidoferrum sp.]|nr:DUF2059 domain-containing protein [Candidatus Acidoferrum sp.]
MKRLPIVLVLCLFAATTCVAQQSDADQPATKADIDRYYDAMHVRDLMKSTMDAVSKQMRQMMHDQIQKTPNLPPDAEEQIDKMYDKMLKQMPIDELLDAMEPVYAKHFTKGDIDAMIAFYSTPVGKKMLAEMPAITQEAMAASSGVIRKFMDQAMQEAQDQLAQMQKSAQPGAKKATSTN